MTTLTTRQQVRRVLLITLILNLLVALGKILLGLFSGALAITADGFHSMVDAMSNVGGLIANTIADRPPDDDHPYGHRRFETMAALFIGALLLVTAWEIGQGALERVQGGVLPEITPLMFAVMLGTLAVNLFVSRYESREGQRLKAEILIADAAHTGSDVYVTISVLGSMILVALGWGWADTAAALVVVGLIGRAAWQILRQTGRVLVDTAPYTSEQLQSLIQELPCVEHILRVRSRGPQDAAFIDVDVLVAPEMTASHTENIAQAIRDQLHNKLEGVAEIDVHFIPVHWDEYDVVLTARACADTLGLSTHEVRVSEVEMPTHNPTQPLGQVLELHVEVPPEQTLQAAHQQVSQLEQAIRQRLPDLMDVITHIEPAQGKAIALSDGEAASQAKAVEMRAQSLLDEHNPDVNWHDLQVRPTPDGLAVTVHAELPPQISIEAAHNIAETAEVLLRNSIALLDRVTIHTEPPDQL